MKSYLRPAIALFLGITLITGAIYPLLITGIGKAFFPEQAQGSLIKKDGNIVGSSLIGQNFTDSKYFWGRPSATSPYPNNAAASSGSNQGPLNLALMDAVNGRIAALKQTDPDNKLPVPVDLVTASASGLDPEISPAAAIYQIDRVAKTRGFTPEQVTELVQKHIQGRQFGILGEPRVNVLALNLALDETSKTAK
ncbi:potassium-transporting ATPase subunit KdpC [Methyloradius palustris]|uniref:Potassium-transporting ATPase KdpC subunit n=1 Tax=Methyloradius palustris TaxID=2778876 RepID=A0A8D5GD59_9PROT|nr:potassium-transporting ATPase subunit KdpC [Methyloradius palustris]BCM26116.1 potassium-transporting ATPase KdpC subunit [Methyloradius palustris]